MRLQLIAVISVALALLLLSTNAQSSESGALYPPGLLPLINRANQLLSAGQFNEAAKTYTEAIELSPADYVLYYKRATAYYSSNRHSQALADFDHVLSLTGDSFDRAHIMKARIHARDGNFVSAKEEIKKYNAKVKRDPAVQEILMSVSEGEIAARKANQAKKAKLWTACVEAASTAIATATHSLDLRQLRAECALASGDIESAVGDLTRLTHLTTPSTDLLMKIFRLSYFLLPYSASTSPALSALKQCLHYDPDSKQCLPAHRLIKSFDRTFQKLDKAQAAAKWRDIVDLLVGSEPERGFASKFDEALTQHTSPEALRLPLDVPLPPAQKTSPRRELILRALCKAYINLNQADKGEQWCTELSQMHGLENDADALVGRAEAALKKEEWEDAVRLLEKAFESSGRSNREIHQRLQRAQKLLKQSKQKDYYKILDVARDADAKTIKKAFRRAAMKAHPDKGGSEAKMAAVNEAYEVLSNPELRQRFDNGDDPNDPMGSQGAHPFPGGFPGGFSGGGHPFAQFFQQAGGFPGGFQFHFSQPGQHGRGR
ncbi:DnaJ-domain-containing protein [Panus rudis PR-1116 ss-1]|nr:DnaJ-domain-containing protein [Panus rudis PR-1116 ss-1]